MDAKKLEEMAHQRASLYAPRPKRDPIETRMYGGLIAFASVFICGMLAGLDMERGRYALAAVVTSVIGFLVPFLYLKNKERLYWKEYFHWKEHLRGIDSMRAERTDDRPS